MALSRLSCGLVASAIALCSAPALASDLTVRVTDVSPRGGDIRLALYDERGYAGREGTPVAVANVPAAMPETLVVVRHLPPGRYAAKLFQDLIAVVSSSKTLSAIRRNRSAFRMMRRLCWANPLLAARASSFEASG